MTLVGLILTYPQGPSTPAARSAIDLSISVFDIFGKSFAVAVSAANIVRHLCIKVDFLREQSRAKQGVSSGMPDTNLGASEEQIFTGNSTTMMDLGNVNWGLFDMTEASGDLFDMALGVDFWGDLDTLWPNTTAAAFSF
jgi:hypothetical protein